MKEEKVAFQSGNLTLEGVVSIPSVSGTAPAVIVCHPHPLYGGDMDNNVVFSLCQSLSQKSFVTFRFNFRGVGGSEGSFSQGEQEDVSAAISFLYGLKGVDARRIGIAGYSAGAVFSLPVGVKDKRVKALAAISPPFSMSNFDFLRLCTKPKLIISGSEDDFTPPDKLLRFCRSLVEPKECEIIEGIDHFWWGHEPVLADKVTGFFLRTFTM